MNGSDPASSNELTDEQLDALLGSAGQELLRHIQDTTDLTATLTWVLTSPTNTETGANAPAPSNAATGATQPRHNPRATLPDADAWDELVKRYTPLVVSICVRYQLTTNDIDDIRQTVWLRLVENIENLREPAALPSWLAATTRRECLRVLGARRRHDDVEWPPEGRSPASTGDTMIDTPYPPSAELPPLCRELLAMLASDPRPSDTEIGQKLGIPAQYVGPLYARLLSRLGLSTSSESDLGDRGRTAMSFRDVPH